MVTCVEGAAREEYLFVQGDEERGGSPRVEANLKVTSRWKEVSEVSVLCAISDTKLRFPP